MNYIVTYGTIRGSADDYPPLIQLLEQYGAIRAFASTWFLASTRDAGSIYREFIGKCLLLGDNHQLIIAEITQNLEGAVPDVDSVQAFLGQKGDST